MTSIRVVALLVLVSFSSAARAESEAALRSRTLQFQPEAQAVAARQLAIIDTLSFGRRIGRPVPNNGAINRLVAEFGALDWLQIGGELGVALDSVNAVYSEYGGGVAFTPLDQRRDRVLNLKIDTRAIRESDGWVVLAGAAVSRTFGGWTPTGSIVLEKPFIPGRDSVDAIFSVGVDVAVARHGRLGLEATGSDLEALWEAEEAEGGARLVAGPVVAWDFLDRRMTVAAAAVAGVATLPRPTMTGDPAPVEPSMTGRASLAYTFF